MHGVDNDGSLGFHYDGDCIVSSPCDHSVNVVLSSPVESCPGSGRWLLDSGASVSVVSPKVLEGMVHGDLKRFDGPLQAANGTPVSIQGFCRALIQVEVTGPKGNVVPAVIPLVVMVGDCAFPILSIGKLSKQGWKVSIGKEVSMIHEKTQCSVNGIEIWCDTPWIKVSKFTGTWKGDLSADLNDEAPEKSGHVKALTADEMVAHRLRGHVLLRTSLLARFVSLAEVFTNTDVGRVTSLALRCLQISDALVKRVLKMRNRVSNFWSSKKYFHLPLVPLLLVMTK